MQLLESIEAQLNKIVKTTPSIVRLQRLQALQDYLTTQLEQGKTVKLNFICTHNSRRSQFSQVWAQAIAAHFDLPIQTFSGGMEVTAFHENAVRSLERSGFVIEKEGEQNPHYHISYAEGAPKIKAFSKHFDDPANPSKDFAAVMTCSHADENCPFVSGAAIRISIPYEDPKAFDGTAAQDAKYDERSAQIASELFYVFQEVQVAIVNKQA